MVKQRSPLLGLQKALYDRLKAKLTIPIYDAVPEGAAFPYITIGEDSATDWSTKLTPGQEVESTIHIWSRYAGMAEVKQLIDQVIQSLTAAPLDLTPFGWQCVVHALVYNATERDPDGITRHSVLRFRFRLQDISVEVI